MKGKVIGYERHVAAVMYHTGVAGGHGRDSQEGALTAATEAAFARLGHAFRGARWILEQLTVTPQTETTNIILAVGRRVKRNEE